MKRHMVTISKKTLHGYTLAVAYVIMIAISSVAVQSLERTVPDFQLGIFRYIGGALFASLPVFYSGLSFKIPIHLVWPVLNLAIYSMIYNVLFYFAVSVLPLSHASSLTYVFQTLVMAIISRVLLNEKCSLPVCTSVFGCVVGMLLLLQPWLDFNQGFTPGFAATMADVNHTYLVTQSNASFETSVITTTQSFNKELLLLGYIAVALAGGVEAFTITLVSKCLGELDRALLVFYTSSISILPQTLCCLYLEQPVLVTDPYSMFLIAAHAAALALGLMALNHACLLISPMQVMLVCNVGSVFNIILQYTVLSAQLYGRRNALEVAGCLVITLSIMISALSKDESHEELI